MASIKKYNHKSLNSNYKRHQNHNTGNNYILHVKNTHPVFLEGLKCFALNTFPQEPGILM